MTSYIKMVLGVSESPRAGDLGTCLSELCVSPEGNHNLLGSSSAQPP